MTQLIRYEAACRAIAEAKQVDEVKDMADKAEAMRVYARQAQNRDMEVDAAEIRIRAERRLGEMIAEQKATTGLNKGAAATRSSATTALPKLADAGISKDLSSRAQKLAELPPDKFEGEVAAWREKSLTDARVSIQLVKPVKPTPPANSGAKPTKAKRTFEPAPEMDAESRISELAHTVTELAEENTKLRDAVAVAVMPPELQEDATQTIADLRARIKQLEAELEAVCASRDTLMRTNGEMKRQIASMQRQMKAAA